MGMADFDPFALAYDMDEELLTHDPHRLLTEQQVELLVDAGQKRLESAKEATGGLWSTPGDPEARRQLIKGMTPTARRRAEEKRERKLKIIDFIGRGLKLEEVMAKVGIAMPTYYNYRSQDTEFAKLVDRAKAAARETRAVTRHLNPHQLPFYAFRHKYLGRETYPYQQIIIDIIEQAPEGEITMILLPPGVGKTMTMEDYLTYVLAQNQSNRIIYVSETDRLGETVMDVIKERFTNDVEFEELIEDFGPFFDPEAPMQHRKTWRRTAIRLEGANIGARDYNLQTRGWNSQIYSLRPDIIVLDDIQTDNTLNQTEAMLAKLRKTVLTRREGGYKGKIIYVGTRLGIQDLPGEMIRQDMVLPENVYVLPLLNSDGYSNFEETIPTSAIPLIIRQQKDQFQTVYQQNPLAQGGETFGDVLDKIKDYSRTIRGWWDQIPQKEVLGRIVAVDPALDGGNAVVALAWSMNHIWVLDLDVQFKLNKMSRIEDIMLEMILTYQADTVIVEDKAFQKALFTSERLNSWKQQYGFSIHAHTTGSEKHDPIFGVAKMEATMNGGLTIPYGDEYSQERMNPLLQQLSMWRPDVPTKSLIQDAVMALWFPWVYIIHARRRKALQQDQSRSILASQMRYQTGLPFPKTTLRGRRAL